MLRDLERRGALALLTLPLATTIAAAAQPETPPATDRSVSFPVWMQINALVHGYSDCLDRMDIAGLDRVFTADATYDYAPGATKVGRQAIRDFLQAALVNQARTIHFLGVPNVTPAAVAGSYSCWTSVMARHEGKNGQNHVVYGRYVDTIQPDGETGALLIAHRKVVSQIAEGVSGQRYWMDRGAS